MAKIYLFTLLIFTSCMFQQTSNTVNRDPKEDINEAFLTSDVVILNSCACQNSKSISSNQNCASFCFNKNHSDQILYFDIGLNPKRFLNTNIQNLYNWCTVERTSSNNSVDQSNPGCTLSVEDEEGFINELDVTINPGNNKVTTNISTLNFNNSYKIKLMQSPSRESSDEVQFLKVHPLDNANFGTLQIAPVNYYECDNFRITETDNNIFYAYKTHYYFSQAFPSIIPLGNPQIKCHEYNGDQTNQDAPNKPRLALNPGVFSVWSLTDPRFYDNDQDGKIDLLNILESKTGFTDLPEIFQPHTHAIDPIGVNGPDSPLGFIMSPWKDPDTQESFCLENTHYQSSDTLFRELGNLIGFETEAIYRANRAEPIANILNPETGVFESIPVNSFVDVSETILKKMWFTLDQFGNEVNLTEQTVSGADIYFWWPYDPVKEAALPRPSWQDRQSQIRFRVMDLNTGSNSSSHDKRFGCIPKK